MKRLSQLFFAALILGLFAVPSLAQDTNGSAAAQNPIYYVIVVILALLLVGAMVFGAYITKYLATLVPAETAASIYQSGLRFGLQVALNQAAKTTSPLDDEFFVDIATQRGYQVEKLPGGGYEIKVPVPTPATAAVPPDSTLEWKQRPSNRDA